MCALLTRARWLPQIQRFFAPVFTADNWTPHTPDVVAANVYARCVALPVRCTCRHPLSPQRALTTDRCEACVHCAGDAGSKWVPAAAVNQALAVWTIVNRANATVTGAVLTVTSDSAATGHGAAGNRFYDCYTGKELSPQATTGTSVRAHTPRRARRV